MRVVLEWGMKNITVVGEGRGGGGNLILKDIKLRG
jgi:hypothetical protein